jgi:hypothetical protein
LIVAAVVWFAAFGTTLAATSPVTIAAKVGYSGFVKAQQWMPVTIDVTNSGPDIDGILEVSSGAALNGAPIGSAIYQTHLSLASGTTKHLKTYLTEDQAPAPVSVRIMQNGKMVASADAQPASAATALIGVLSDQSTAMDSFAAVHPGGISANVVHLSLENLSDSAIHLRAFDLLVIDDFATDTLTSTQRSALTDFVQSGGPLLLGTGASWRKTLAGIAPAILPMTIEGTAMLNAVKALDNVSRLEIAIGALNGGAHAWLAEGGKPLLVQRFIGGGSVTLATFDWNQEPVAGSSGTQRLLRQTLVRTVASSSNQSIAFPQGGSGASSISQRSNPLLPALGSLPALDLPSLVVIGLLVLAYVLLVGPINYFTLRALHHRALAWVTVPLIAVLASAGAFGAGVFTKGRSVQTNQVSIVHLQPGWDRAYQESYTGVLAPTRGDYEVRVKGSRPSIGPIFSGNGGIAGANADIIRVSEDNNSIMLPGMTAFVLRGFASEAVTDAPHLVGHTKLVNGKLTGTISNDSNVTFSDAVILAGDGFQRLPALAPGGTASFEVIPKVSNAFGAQPALYTIYSKYFNGPQPGGLTDADREGIQKTSILSVVAGINVFSPAIAPMLVAWTKQPYEQITVSGSQPRATAMTAVVLPLTFEAIGAGPLPPGMVVSHFTDIEGDTQPGPPDALMIQNGLVTYEFAPGIAPGMHLTSAKLDATSQNPKMSAIAGSSSQGVQARYWDWSTSNWVPMAAYSTSGTSALPDAAIEPSSNEVRLQIATGGTMAFLGAISLTGTVK